LNCTYGGLGQSLGSLLGGTLSKQLGIMQTFFLCGLVDSVILMIYLVYCHHHAHQWQPTDTPTSTTTTTTTASVGSAADSYRRK
jgi:hypothetical protein